MPFDVRIIGLAEFIVGVVILGGMAELHVRDQLVALGPETPLEAHAQHPDWLRTVNLADYPTPELARALVTAERNGALDYSAFVQAVFAEPIAVTILSRAGFVGAVTELTTPAQVAEPVTSVEALMQYAAEEAVAAGQSRILLSHVLLALAEHDQSIATEFLRRGMSKEDLEATARWYDRLQAMNQHRFFWERGKVGIWGIGRDWAAGSKSQA